MNEKITKEELWKMDIIDVYKLVLRGDIIKIFPNGTWQRPDALHNAKKLLLYVIEQEKLSDKEILGLNTTWFKKNKLLTPLGFLFNASPPIYINYVLDNKFNIWDFKNAPQNYWNKDTAKEVFLFKIKEQKLTEEDILNLESSWFLKNGLKTPLNHIFNNSPTTYINYVFDGKFNIWDFKKVPANYWTKKTAKEAFLFKIKEQNLTDKDILNLNKKWFFKNGLATPLNTLFHNSRIAYINYVFEDKFNIWDFKNVSHNYWTKETSKEAFLFKIKEQNLTEEDILNLNIDWFFKNGLATPLNTLFHNSRIAYINYAINKKGNNKTMNEKITKEELWRMDIIDVYKLVLKGDIIKKFPNGTWQRPDALNNAKKLLLYIIEKEKLSDKEILSLESSWFYKNKLKTPFSKIFNSSPSTYINYAFEGKFNIWDFKTVPNDYWTKETAKEAFLFKIKKQKLTEDDILNLNKHWFVNNQLTTPLNIVFVSSPPAYINYVFDGKFNIWDFKTVPNDYWTKETSKEAFLFKIKEQNLTEEDILNLGANWFYKNKLTTPFSKIFNSSPSIYINYAFEDKFNMWDFKIVPENYWNKETSKEAFLFKIKEQNLTDKDALNLNKKWFFKNGLTSALNKLFNGSPSIYVNYVFEDKFNIWDFKNVPNNYWTKETSKEAFLFKIKEQNLTEEDILNLNIDWFFKNGLATPLRKLFNNSPTAYINYATTK